jgi:predicted nucleotidyltransferase
MLDKLLGSQIRAKLLSWLLLHPDGRYFVRQLKPIVNEDATNISRELARLAKMGILTSRTEGRQKYYQANRECPFFIELQGLVIKTYGVVDVLQMALKPLAKRIEIAFIYGSFARGTIRPESDIDLVIIGKCRFGDVVEVIHDVQGKIGREINPTVYSSREWQQKLVERHHFVKSVREAEKIFIVGNEDELARTVR